MDSSQFIESVKNREAVVSVIGLGYVGLPLVREFCGAGFRVIGFDTDKAKTEALNAGESYIAHIPSDEIRAMRDKKLFEATSEPARIAEADAILICVPTPLTKNKEPDLSYVESTGHAIAENLREGMLIVLESTTYPGTTEDVLAPVLETSGLKAGKDFLLAYSPEREDPGNPAFSAGKIPKVVGGCDQNALDAALALYGEIVTETIPVSSARTAEAVKLLENIFRSVNIALVNELKMIYAKMDIDIWEVIGAAETKPFGFMPFYPGPGLGGHCIPIDPFYLAWKAREYDIPTRFIELAGEINTGMPEYVITRVVDALNENGKALRGSRILILGVAYKADVADPRESPSFTLITEMQKRGARVDYNDPHVPVMPPMRHFELTLESIPLTEENLSSYDCVLIVTAHSDYDWDFIVEHAPLVVDTRNATKDVQGGREKIRKA